MNGSKGSKGEKKKGSAEKLRSEDAYDSSLRTKPFIDQNSVERPAGMERNK
jgi:hypothetical protein